MAKSLRLATVVGARPQFIKAATLSRLFQAHPHIDEFMIHTGQHYDSNMSDVFFEELNIPQPAHKLSIAGVGHGAMTGRMMEEIETLLLEHRYDAMLVYGDTNSTLAGALAASKLHIPVIHVEAGLRSFNKKMPEEINRILTDHVSTLLSCPTVSAVAQLRKEGIEAGVFFTGDVNFDATLYAIEQSKSRSHAVRDLGLENESFVLSTLHRAENTDDLERLKRILMFIEETAASRRVVLPLHPRTRKILAANGLTIKNVQVTEPLGYFDMHQLLGHCDMVLTDSGGVQKEAYFHQKPCVTLRDETEWTETIEAGWNRLWTTAEWKAPRSQIPDYGTGSAAQEILSKIEAYFLS